MESVRIVNLSRRDFLKGSLGAGAVLTLGVCCPAPRAVGTEARGFEPNAFVRIASDDSVTVIIKHLEMGQGTYTGLATLVAEELDAAWEQIRVEGAPADAARYNNLFWGPMQGTGGSTAMANSFTQMREAGAAARQMLVAAAAQLWGVPASEITIRAGRLRHAASGRETGFGALVGAAAAQPVPEQVFLKDAQEFRLIGTRLPRKDGANKVDGSAVFTQDVKLPGMLTALVAHPPRFGARLSGFDPAPARKIKDVVDVVEIPSGVAVLAQDFWAAAQGRAALAIEWDESGAFSQGSREIIADYRKLADQPGATARAEGDTEGALARAAVRIAADYEFPFLAHAAMEPMNCVIRKEGGSVTIYNGEQLQTQDQRAVAAVLGVEPEAVRINMLYAGGSFGRRANPSSDYLVEAAHILKARGGDGAVKLVWTREDDMRAGWFRPMYFHRLQGGLDGDGKPLVWTQRIVGQSILAGTAFTAMMENGLDVTSVEGASNLAYAIPNLAVDLHTTILPVPVQWWRSVGHTHTAFAVETFVDELAAAAGADPVEFRLSLLGSLPRHRAVLELAAAKAGWGRKLSAGRGLGVAVHESFNTRVAQVAEVALREDGGFTVERVVIAVDCGLAVNPDIVRAQMEGGMAYGLAAALESEITLAEGRVQQSNFDDYRVLRMHQMPEVEVHIVESAEPPTGVGEPATPVIAPAVANALAAAGGPRLHRLPLTLPA